MQHRYGTCATLVVFGCTDDSYLDMTPTNTDDGTCATLVVFGCTDDSYLEYDASANTDDGTCVKLVVFGCTDDSLEYDVSKYR